MPAPVKVHFEVANAGQLDTVFRSLTRRVNELTAAEKRNVAATKESEAAQERAANSALAHRLKYIRGNYDAEQKAEKQKEALAEKEANFMLRQLSRMWRARNAYNKKVVADAKKAADELESIAVHEADVERRELARIWRARNKYRTREQKDAWRESMDGLAELRNTWKARNAARAAEKKEKDREFNAGQKVAESDAMDDLAGLRNKWKAQNAARAAEAKEKARAHKAGQAAAYSDALDDLSVLSGSWKARNAARAAEEKEKARAHKAGQQVAEADAMDELAGLRGTWKARNAARSAEEKAKLREYNAGQKVAESDAMADVSAFGQRMRERQNERRASRRISESQAERDAMEELRQLRRKWKNKNAAKTDTPDEPYMLGGGPGGLISQTLSTARRAVTGMGVGLGTYALASSVSDAISTQTSAILLQNMTRARNGNVNVSSTQLERMFHNYAMKTGYKAGDVAAGFHAAGERGGGWPGVKAFMEVGDYALNAGRAYGASAARMGEIVAASSKLGIRGDELKGVIAHMTRMGNEGDIELYQQALQIRRLKGVGMQFEKGPNAIIKAVAMAQMAGELSGSPHQATFAIEDLVREFTTSGKAKKLTMAGFDLAKKDRLRDPVVMGSEVIDAIYDSSNAKHFPLMKEIFGKKWDKSKDEQLKEAAFGYISTGASRRIMVGMQQLYKDGYTDEAGRRHTGRAAIVARYGDVLGTDASPEAMKRSAEAMQSSAETKLAQAHARLEAEMSKLIPRIAELAPALGDLGVGIAKVAKLAVENPKTAIGAVFSTKVLSELMTLQMSKALEGDGLVSKAMHTAFAAGTIAITATSVTLTAMKIWDELSQHDVHKGENFRNAVLDIENQTRNVIGKGPGAIGEAEAAVADAKARLLANEAPSGAKPVGAFDLGALGPVGQPYGTHSGGFTIGTLLDALRNAAEGWRGGAGGENKGTASQAVSDFETAVSRAKLGTDKLADCLTRVADYFPTKGQIPGQESSLSKGPRTTPASR